MPQGTALTCFISGKNRGVSEKIFGGLLLTELRYFVLCPLSRESRFIFRIVRNNSREINGGERVDRLGIHSLIVE